MANPTKKVTAPVTALDPVLDDEGIPDFLKRPFANEGALPPIDGVMTEVTAPPVQKELSPVEEFRAKNPYTPRDLEIIAQIEKDAAGTTQAVREAEKVAKQSKREAAKAEQERLRQIRIDLRRQQGVQKQEWDE